MNMALINPQLKKEEAVEKDIKKMNFFYIYKNILKRKFIR